MTTKWASPGHFHSLASSDQALAQEAVAQGPGKCWPQMLRCFRQCVSSSKERKGAVWASVWEVDSGSQSCIWQQLCPHAGLKLRGHSNAFRLKAIGFSHLASLTGEGAFVGALLFLPTQDRAARCTRPWAACSQNGRAVCSCPSYT